MTGKCHNLKQGGGKKKAWTKLWCRSEGFWATVGECRCCSVKGQRGGSCVWCPRRGSWGSCFLWSAPYVACCSLSPSRTHTHTIACWTHHKYLRKWSTDSQTSSNFKHSNIPIHISPLLFPHTHTFSRQTQHDAPFKKRHNLRKDACQLLLWPPVSSPVVELYPAASPLEEPQRLQCQHKPNEWANESARWLCSVLMSCHQHAGRKKKENCVKFQPEMLLFRCLFSL